MNRKEFIEKLGIGAAFVLTTSCLGACRSDEVFKPSGPVDFTIDLSSAEFDALNTNGGYVVHQGTVVAKDNLGNLVAATQTCSHEGLEQIIYKDDEWFCTAHEARYALDGDGLNANGSDNLTIYNIELDGTMLRVFS